MKVTKKTGQIGCLICIFLLTNILLTGCPSPFVYGRHPTEQPGTIWRSEDGNIEFYVPKDETDPVGTMKVNGETLDILIYMWTVEPSVSIHLRSVAETYTDHHITEPMILDGDSQVISKDTFHITVWTSPYFQEGDTIVFHKVDS